MKAVAVLFAATAFASVAAQGQGQFVFNTHDPSAGNDIQFFCNGFPIGDSYESFAVAVFAGLDFQHLQPLTPVLTLNRIGAGAGYTQPFALIYTVPGLPGGTSAAVAYQAFQGSSYQAAAYLGPLVGAESNVTLTEPPSPPNEVRLGTHSIAVCASPEPSTWPMFLLGLVGIIFAVTRHG